MLSEYKEDNMALKKIITMPNGLPLEYHKIAKIDIEPNQQITILRHSYLNEGARQYEKDYAEGKIEDEPIFPYVDHEYIHIDYKENIDEMTGDTLECAYKLLKKHRPEFGDAEDV
jgi:hypothetical protein